MSVDASHCRSTWVGEIAVACTFPGTEGASVSGGGVVTTAAADGPDTFPLTSCAVTVYEYVVSGATDMSEYPGLPTVAISTPSRHTAYPVTPTWSVDASHCRSTWVGKIAVACTFPGTEGASVSGGGRGYSSYRAIIPGKASPANQRNPFCTMP